LDDNRRVRLPGFHNSSALEGADFCAKSGLQLSAISYQPSALHSNLPGLLDAFSLRTTLWAHTPLPPPVLCKDVPCFHEDRKE